MIENFTPQAVPLWAAVDFGDHHPTDPRTWHVALVIGWDRSKDVMQPVVVTEEHVGTSIPRSSEFAFSLENAEKVVESLNEAALEEWKAERAERATKAQ